MTNQYFNKTFKGLKYFLVAAFLLFSFPCCNNDGDDMNNNDDDINIPGIEVKSSLDRVTFPVIDTADLQSQVRGNNDFAFDIYRGVSEDEDGNIFFSPYSISIALAMTWAGAAGETESDMADAMNFILTQEDLHPVFNHIDLELAKRGEGAEGADGKGFRLNIQNSIWGQTGYTFLASFLDVLALNYGAGLRLLDFMSDPEGARVDINSWIEEVTEGRIEELIPEGSLSALTRLVLVNAIYFNAAWLNRFDEESPMGTFHTGAGEDVLVPMMHNQENMPYLAGNGFEAVELLYDGGELSMLVIMPEDLAGFESGLTSELLADIRDNMQDKEVNLSMPSWELKGSTISLKEILSGMGMERAFTAGTADFSGMDGTKDLFISDVLHQAFIKVNEEGTEAAAATAVVMELTAMPVDVVYLRLDRPFIYLIQDKPTGQVLFLGRMIDPR
ncbi:MAG: serpin family protein [Deltaproteobacteria bacterium]|nr:serpin family protein [Deltaproteobacteria bacterium]